ncbi:MAG TPA: MBL fold metallo-hydrolase [Methylomusa anaerophila]|uniref:Beta-lactamase hydrolase-like protein n=1 Tax=Methylomusa anaerophila TaxID=1930071 RepID=A0A348AP31_9FIRM|nr:beta-lactamase hydrolase-like protein [Methylomusa anaerophila]HML87331.1 MBL fold metallo-hydrolase [Methylomusa anaerophila]
MIFQQLSPHYCRTYMVGDEKTGEVALIDPVLDHVNDYLTEIEKSKLKLIYVIDTHTHADHISGCPALRDRTDCQYIMHQNALAGCVSRRVNEADSIQIGQITMQAIFTPGHTQDSICLLLADRIMTGDTLFLDDGGAGRDDLPGGDAATHWQSLQKLANLPDHLVVYPAHEYRNRQSSTLREQKLRNPHFQHRTREEFVSYLNRLKLGPAEWMKDVLEVNATYARDPQNVWIPMDLPACEVQGAWDKGVNDQQVVCISAEKLYKWLNSSDVPILLDVRELSELTGPLGYIQGIVHIPLGELAGKLNQLRPYQQKDIVVICRSGHRATTGAQILQQAGFEKIQVLQGGMIAWLDMRKAKN